MIINIILLFSLCVMAHGYNAIRAELEDIREGISRMHAAIPRNVEERDDEA